MDSRKNGEGRKGRFWIDGIGALEKGGWDIPSGKNNSSRLPKVEKCRKSVQEKPAHQSLPLVPTGQVESAEGPGQAGGSGDGS